MRGYFERKITRKIWLLTIGIPLIMGVLIVTAANILSFNGSKDNVKNLDAMLRNDFDRESKFEVQIVHSLIASIHSMQKKGEISNEKAQKLAKNIIRELRYGNDGYFWIDTKEGVNLVNLGLETEGTNRYNMKDSHGKFVIQELNTVAQEDGGGYTDYWYPKKGETEPSPKRGYSLAYKPYDWVIGTGNYIDDIDAIIALESEKNKEHLIHTIYLLISIGAFVLLISALISFKFGKRISNPIIDMAGKIRHIAEGNLQVEVQTSLKDEIGSMAKSMQAMIKNLTAIVERIKAGANNISQASREVSSSAESIAQGANEQASSTEEISSSMEEMASSISQNSTNSQEASNIATSASEHVDKVQSSFDKMLDSLNLITAKISIIHEIAEKTDLLAINASIEAAKAGENGKGFAVVANEVRQLAIRCRNAADEIDTISADTVSVSTESGKLLKGLIPEIQKTSSLIQEISAASLEQDSGAQQVNQALLQLNTVTQQNSASSEELAAAAANLDNLANQLIETISFLAIAGDDNDEIGGLLTMIDKYNMEIGKIQERIKLKNGPGNKKKSISQTIEASKPPKGKKTETTQPSGVEIALENDSTDEDFETF